MCNTPCNVGTCFTQRASQLPDNENCGAHLLIIERTRRINATEKRFAYSLHSFLRTTIVTIVPGAATTGEDADSQSPGAVNCPVSTAIGYVPAFTLTGKPAFRFEYTICSPDTNRTSLDRLTRSGFQISWTPLALQDGCRCKTAVETWCVFSSEHRSARAEEGRDPVLRPPRL